MSVHIIIGSDDYLLAEAARKHMAADAGVETIDSLNSQNAELQLHDIQEVKASLMTPPFLEPTKVTWWKNVTFLPGGGGKKAAAEDVKVALEAFAEHVAAHPLPENQTFILTAPQLLKTSKFAKMLSTVAEMVFFAAEKPWQAERNAVVRVIDLAKDCGLTFEPGVAEKFVSRVGTDARSLVSELEKLRDYLGAERTTVKATDIADVSSQGVGVEPVVWDVTDAIGNRDMAAALAALHRFELESGFDVFMSGIIERQFRQLCALKEAEAAGRLGEALAGQNPFSARKNAAFLAKWTLRELVEARARFVRLRESVVSGTSSGGVLIVTELLRVMRKERLRT